MDIRSDNPVGRVPDTRSTRRGLLRLAPDGWRLGPHSGSWTGSGPDRLLDRLDVLHSVHCTGTPLPGVAQVCAQTLHRAVARGTYISGILTADVADHVTTELLTTIRPTPHPGEIGDLDWDVACVEQRRAALRPLVPRLPEMSVVLVSRRPDLVPAMVRRLAQQRYPDLEIVVGVHGAPVPPGLGAAAGDRPVVARQLDANLVFGDALNEAFSLASGELVNKMDDDDYIGADHLWDLAAAHAYSGATLVGKTTTVVYLEALDATVRRVFGARESFTHRVAGSTMTLAREDLRSVGGWASVPRGVDTELLASVHRHGGTTYQPHDIGYLYVRGSDPHTHTWTTDVGHFLRNVREQWIGMLQHPAFGTGTDSEGAA
ncbi:glycosyltransferase [Ruania albidiflava]|uniref:glycosyltransferase n=1 Tax=Ruania albidiflava TaxID=366586 RepID=UPI0003B3A7C7|nr:glycosyltransferase [Ruania albidiflava]